MPQNFNKIALFEEKEIRKVWDDDHKKWLFSVIDVVGALTDSNKPRDYWYRLKQRASKEEKVELSTNCRQLKLQSTDGKKYTTDVAARHRLTEEWDNRGAKNGKDYAILTNEIYKTGFGFTAREYKDYKNLSKPQNLRDSMSNMELALTNLGEATAAELHQKNNSYGLDELKRDTKSAGKVVKSARESAEEQLGASVISKENYLN